MSNNESKSNQALGRHEPRHPDDVLPQDDAAREQQAKDKSARSARRDAERERPDARPGREYQGSGVMNEHQRYGSSARPEDLTQAERDERK
ncbi:MAG: hypothetical protein LT106_08215 [Burkholderiaceae bacterium]|nr:hypothetical protein [Burkholderiaceae bacterium]